MKRLLIGIATALAASAAVTAIAAPYEDYKIQIERVQETKLKGPRQAPAEGDMHGKMAGMQEMDRQLQEARSVDQMSPEQMRNWIEQHVRLMDQMNRQTMGDQAPMMGGHGMPSGPAR